MFPIKFKSRVRLAALPGVNAALIYKPSRERLLFFWVTFTCALAGRSAVHKPMMVSDEEEIRAFIKSAVKTALPSKTGRRHYCQALRQRNLCAGKVTALLIFREAIRDCAIT